VVDQAMPDYLTVSTAQLKEQFQYLLNGGYSIISMGQLINYTSHKVALPPRPVLLTFDDGYRNNLWQLYPLLQLFQLPATIFLIGQKTMHATEVGEAGEYLTAEDIQTMDKGLVSFGIHSYSHESYASLSLEKVSGDIDYCQFLFDKLGITVLPCLAYPYGAFPKNDKRKQASIEEIFRKKNIQLAFRIGNRLNRLPLKNRFLVQRIDIRGDESFNKFRRKLKYGNKLL